jgi:hypothetical protein
MKHYFGYRANGSLASLHSYHGGWPANLDLADENSTEELVVNQRQRLADDQPDIVGYLPFICDCDGSMGTCNCLSTAHKTMYADTDGGVLVMKSLTSDIKIDGVTVADGARLIRAPGTKLQFHVVCPDVADGQVLSIFNSNALLTAEGQQHTLTVSGGQTPVLELTAPAQGSFGQLLFGGIQFVPARIDVVGFA